MNVEEETDNSQQQDQNSEQNQNSDQNQNQNNDQQQSDADKQSLIDGDKDKGQQQEEFVPLTAADITFPEGLEVNEALRDEALTIVNNRELSPKEQLQGLIDLQGRLAKEASDTISETWKNTQKEWQDEVKADPTIGGDKLPATLAAVNRLVAEYGDDKLVEAFAMTGAGNNVHVIRFLNAVAGKLLEGGAVLASSSTNQEEDAASRMFPSMKKG